MHMHVHGDCGPVDMHVHEHVRALAPSPRPAVGSRGEGCTQPPWRSARVCTCLRCEWATLLSGTDEGVYGWVTVNYLLDALYPPAAGTATVPPVGIIDLGGGSVQVGVTGLQG